MYPNSKNSSGKKKPNSTADEKRETYRLRTFLNFPEKCPMDPIFLAKAGFFYIGCKDKVKCFSCKHIVGDWAITDDPMDKRWHLQNCSFTRGLDESNITQERKPIKLTQNYEMDLSLTSYGFSDYGPFSSKVDFSNHDNEVEEKKIKKPVDPYPHEVENLKRQFPCLNPVNFHMKDFNARLQTFDQRWPSQKVNATPNHIAKAGFYFLGERDRVKCWYCNGGLQNWEPNDEPFAEHAKWFPGCEFILKCQGVEFVKQVVSKYPDLRRPALQSPRFDHKTQNLIPAKPFWDQQQPAPVNSYVKNVLRRYSPLIFKSQNQIHESKELETQLSKLEEKAIEMGFELPLVKKIIQKRIKSTKKYFENINDFVEALVSCHGESMLNIEDQSKHQLGRR